MLGDMDTQFGSVFGDAIGPEAEGNPSPHAPRVAVALESLGVSIMAPFPGYRQTGDDVGSWYVSANDTRIAIDAITTSPDVAVIHGSCSVVTKFDTRAPNRDHLPVTQLARLPIMGQRLIVRRRTAQHSRSDVRVATKGEDASLVPSLDAFKAHMATPPLFPHYVEDTSHRHLAGRYMHDGLVEHFPHRPGHGPIRKRHLSDNTVGFIRRKAVRSMEKHHTGRCIAKALPRFAFRWRCAACSHLT